VSRQVASGNLTYDFGGVVAKREPETRERYPHFVAITTRWMDNDVYQHINNVHYYSFFDTAVNEYMMRHGVLDLERCPVICLVVETGCQYFAPISFPDTVHCGLRVAHLGTSSVRFEIGIFRNDDPRAAAQGHFVHVTCDRASHRPVAMPADMRAVLERLRVAGC
jgi:acyl-CoA thioester hydrolase